MNTWFTSDNHFGHAKVIEYCKRPFDSLEHMHSEMVRRWNERVAPGDKVIHLGDFGFGDKGQISAWRKQLNGTIEIYRGNHDRSLTFLLSCGFETALNSGVMVVMRPEWSGAFTLAHWPRGPSVLDEAGVRDQLCGHVHERWRVQRDGSYTWYNVGVDQWDFYPVSLDEILAGKRLS